MSNRMTESQGEKATAWAKKLGGSRVNPMFDCGQTGVDGAKEALWYFAERQLDVRLAWSPTMHNGSFADKQPEDLSAKTSNQC